MGSGQAAHQATNKMKTVDFTLLDVLDTIEQTGWSEVLETYPEVSGHYEVIQAALKARSRELSLLQDYEKAKGDTEVIWGQAELAIGCK